MLIASKKIRKILSTNKNVFIFIGATFCSLSVIFSQNDVNFQLVDSFELNINLFNTDGVLDNGYSTNIKNSNLYIFPTEQNCFLKYDLKLKKLERIKLNSKNKRDDFKAWTFDFTNNFIIAMNFDGTELRKYSFNGELIKSIKPKFNFSKFQVSYFNNFKYDEKNDLFFVAIQKKFNENYLDKSIKKAINYYKRDGLIGVFNKNGKLIKKIGEYDTLYHKASYYYADYYSFIINNKDEILITQQLIPLISIFNLSSNKIEKINMKGAHIQKNHQELFKATEKLSNEQYNSSLIESYGYYKIKQIRNEGIYLRNYQKEIIDTTKSLIEIMPKEKEKSNFCPASSEREVLQKKIINNIPQYLQIFDLEKSLSLYDDLMPFKGNIFFNNNEFDVIWTGAFDANFIRIYKYGMSF